MTRVVVPRPAKRSSAASRGNPVARAPSQAVAKPGTIIRSEVGWEAGVKVVAGRAVREGRTGGPVRARDDIVIVVLWISELSRPMKITLQTGPGVNLVRSFTPGELRVGEQVIRTSCLLTADSLLTDWAPQTFSELRVDHFEPVLAQSPEIVLLGSGRKQRFPDRSIMAAVLSRGICLEVMDTAAACRTFNILVAEDRRVVAALLLED